MNNDIEYLENRPFRNLIMSIGVLPSSYVASMSYQELLYWLCNYLEETVIPTVNNNGQAVEELQTAFTTLHDYVMYYFSNLDVQEEINNKLDQMAEDGSLTNLIKDYVDPIYQAYTQNINQVVIQQDATITNFKLLVNDELESMDSRIRSVTSGSPKGVYATVSALTTADPNHDYIYVVTEDGKWYYYDINDGWTAGGIYQSAGIEENSIGIGFLSKDIKDNITEDYSGVVEYTKTDYKYCAVNTANNTYSLVDVSSSSNYHLYALECTQGDVFEFTSDCGEGIYQSVFVNSTEQTLISYNNAGEATVATNKVVAPVGADLVYFNTRGGRKTRIHKMSSSPVNEYIDKVDTINELINQETITDVKSTATVTTGYFLNGNTDNYDVYANGLYYELDCEAGDVFYFTTRVTGNMAIYGILDENGLIIDSTIGPGTATVYENQKLIIKNVNAKKLVINAMSSYADSVVIKKVTDVTLNAVTPTTFNSYTSLNDFEVEQVQRRCTNLEEQNPFAWKPFDKTYFCFVIDDNNAFFPKAVEIFHNNNVILSSATLVRELDKVWTRYTPSNTKTVKQLLQEMVADGGEVLSHYTGSLAPAGTPDTQTTHYLTTEADWLERTRDVKRTLEANGFDVYGIILADSSIAHTSTGQKYCSLYFDYSDRMGTSPNFHLGARKFFLNSTMQTMQQAKAYIDQCCQTPGFYPFCFHGNRDDEPLVNESDLNELLSYINAKGSDVCVCTTYKYVIDNFGSTELAEAVRQLQ